MSDRHGREPESFSQANARPAASAAKRRGSAGFSHGGGAKERLLRAPIRPAGEAELAVKPLFAPLHDILQVLYFARRLARGVRSVRRVVFADYAWVPVFQRPAAPIQLLKPQEEN